jgi:two-component system sensor histidine kinase UhpB
MQMKYLFTLASFFVLFGANLYASRTDTAYINQINKRSFELRETNPDSCKLLADEAIALSEKINYAKGLGDGYTRLGLLEKNKGNFEGAIRFYQKSLYYRKQLNDPELVARVYSNIGNVFHNSAQFDSAIFYHLESVKIAESLKDDGLISKYSGNLGIAYQKNESPEEALKYYTYSFEYAQKADNADAILLSTINLSSLYIDMNESRKAISYLLQIEETLTEDAAPDDIGNIYNNLGTAYNNLNKVDSALYYFEKAAAIYSAEGLPELGVCLSNMGILYFKTGNPEKAKSYLHNSNVLLLEANRLEVVEDNYMYLANVFSYQGKFDSAEIMMEQHILFRDSVYNQEKASKISEIQTQYETEKKEQIIKRQKLINTGIIVAAVLVLAILLLLFNRRQLKKKLEFEQQLVSDRTRISSDLHDDIGSTLGSISYFSQLVTKLQKENDADKVNALLAKIEEVSGEAVENMSDIVWAIKPDNDSSEKMFLRIQNYASELQQAAELNYVAKIEETANAISLNMEQRKNIYLIFKESIYNAFKYAEATEINFNANYDGNMLTIILSDNGKGFDPQKTNSINGNGLGNLHRRAKEIGATLNVKSANKQGTTITVTLPI